MRELQSQHEEQQHRAAEQLQQLQQQLDEQMVQHQEQQHSVITQMAELKRQLAESAAYAKKCELNTDELDGQVRKPHL